MSVLQTILFPNNKFTLQQSMQWVIDHGYIYHKVDKTQNLFRYRQTSPPPGNMVQYFSKELPNGIIFVFFKSKKRPYR